MKIINKIDITQPLNQKEFLTLFSHLPLNKEEKQRLKKYYTMYSLLISCDVAPEKIWIAVRNIFCFKEQQIKNRLKK